MDNVSARIESTMREINDRVTHGMKARAYSAANELRNSSQMILRGQRSGRTYNVPGTGRMKYNKRNKTATITYRKYTASAQGEPPAVRTGAFRNSWQAKTKTIRSGTNITVTPYVESSIRTDNGSHLLGAVLEYGTRRIAPRPHHDKIRQHALPKIKKIYKRPYF